MSRCLSLAEIERLSSGELAEGEEGALRSHLETCETCRIAFEQYRSSQASANDGEVASKTVTTPPRPEDVDDTSPAAKVAQHFPKIDGYRIVGIVGQGGMGIVYRAVQTRLNRTVALKVLPAIVGTASPSAVTRFRREATAAARLHHTNIVPIYDFGESRDAYYCAMELITGQALNVLIRRFAEQNIGHVGPTRLATALHTAIADPKETATSPEPESDSVDEPPSSIASSSTGRGRPYYQQVARWMADAADALHYAHGEGIVHRDVKPANLILSTDGRIMIADFGLAKVVDDESLTLTGSLLGTLRYISPEQAMAKRVRVDHRTDIYSLGATMYELLCFQPAFPGDDDKEILGAIIARDPAGPRKVDHQVPPELETICLKTLEKSPEARYATARALAEDLRCYINDLPIRAKRPGLARRLMKFTRRHKAAVVAVVAVVLLAGAGAVCVKLWRDGREADIKAFIESGIAFGERGEWGDAGADFARALEIDPDHVRAMLAVAWMKIEKLKTEPELRTTDYREEIDELCRRVLDREPHNLTALNYRGIILKELERYAEAIEVTKRVTDLDPGHYAAWSNLGAYFAMAGDLEKALECLIEGARLAEEVGRDRPVDRANAWRNLAALELYLHEDSAAEHVHDAIDLKRDDVPSLTLRARVRLVGEGPSDWRIALEYAEVADHLADETNARAKRMRALAQLRCGEFAEAAKHARLALELGDLPAINHLIIANAQARLGDAEAARAHLDAAGDAWPSEFEEAEFMAKYDEGILWFESRAELEGLRAETRGLLRTGTS